MFFCQIWEIFSDYFFEYFFSTLPSFLLLTNVRTFVIVPWIPKALLIFAPLYFSLLFRLADLYCFLFKFIDCFLCLPYILQLSSFIGCILFSVLKFLFMSSIFFLFLLFLPFVFFSQNFVSLVLNAFIIASLEWQWHPTPVLLPGKPHWWRSLVGYSPWGR